MQEEQNQSAENAEETPAAEPNETPETNDPLNLMENAPAEESGDVVAATEDVEAEEKGPGRRKIRTGLVVSNKMQKSIVVKVVRRVRHPMYKKYFNKSKKYMAHDENNECKIGDTVRIVETRPLSSRKRWNLDAVVEKAK